MSPRSTWAGRRWTAETRQLEERIRADEVTLQVRKSSKALGKEDHKAAIEKLQDGDGGEARGGAAQEGGGATCLGRLRERRVEVEPAFLICVV